MVIIIKIVREKIGKYNQNSITHTNSITQYNKNCRNWILFLNPTKEAIAPSKEPWGRPIKKINKKDIILKTVRSAIIL